MNDAPETWVRTRAEQYARLGALHARRLILAEQQAEVDAEISRLSESIMAVERTASLAAQVEQAAKPKPNGIHEPDRAADPGA